jgi:hypothetical protein
MSDMKINGKGQLSFDAGFAITMMLVIFMGLLFGFYEESARTVQESKKLVALNSLADATATKLKSFYNALTETREEGNITIEAKDSYISSGDATQNHLSVDYEIEINGNQIIVTDTGPGSIGTVTKTLGFDVGCRVTIDEGDSKKLECDGAPSFSCSC